MTFDRPFGDIHDCRNLRHREVGLIKESGRRSLSAGQTAEGGLGIRAAFPLHSVVLGLGCIRETFEQPGGAGDIAVMISAAVDPDAMDPSHRVLMLLNLSPAQVELQEGFLGGVGGQIGVENDESQTLD